MEQVAYLRFIVRSALYKTTVNNYTAMENLEDNYSNDRLSKRSSKNLYAK
jgi:hypothetical protein